jgi:membrane-bound inhibitor of C-type lysozyme
MHRRNRIIIALITGVTVFATVFAVAASLNVTAASFGAGTANVASCDTDGVATTFDTSYSASAAGYRVTIVHVTGITTPACDGRTMKVTLVGASDASLAEVTVTLATPVASPTNFDFTSSSILAGDVLKVSVVVA